MLRNPPERKARKSYSKDDKNRVYARIQSIEDNNFTGQWHLEEGSKEAMRTGKAIFMRKLLGFSKSKDAIKNKNIDKAKDWFSVLSTLVNTGDVEIRSRAVKATELNLYHAYGDVFYDFSSLSFIFEENGRSATFKYILENSNTSYQQAIFNSKTGEVLLDITGVGLDWFDNTAKFKLRVNGSIEDFD